MSPGCSLCVSELRLCRYLVLATVNIFDGEYVNTYGKDFFMNAPVWKVEELTGGDVLVQLSQEIAPASKNAMDAENIALYFQPTGLKCINWPVNKYFEFPKGFPER